MQHPEVAAYDPGYGLLVRTRVRIATWNLWGRYGPWEARMPVIVENLRAINADIIDHGVATGNTSYIWSRGSVMLVVALVQVWPAFEVTV